MLRSNRRFNQKQRQLQQIPNPGRQRQVMIPLVDRRQGSEQSQIAYIDKRLSNPSKQKMYKLNDPTYIVQLKKQSPFEQFCNSLDKKYAILSPDGMFFLLWNILLILAILYNFFELPVSIFLTEQVYQDQFSSPAWVFVNILFLVAIFIDMVFVRPNLAFYENGQLITRRYVIMKKYFKFEVYLDIVSFLVLLVYISADYRSLVYLKILFYLKIYSLHKVDKSLINYLELHKLIYLLYIFFRITLILLFIVIWISAVYFAIDYFYYTQQDTYFQNNQLWLTDTLGGVDFIQQITWPYWLLYAAYWASQITATIGYGVGTPRNPVTVAYCCFVIVLMTVVFALFINTIWSIIEEIQQSSTQYYQSWSSLNKILKQKQISQSITVRVSQYFHQVWKYNDKKIRHSIHETLSQNLKHQLLTLSHLHITHDIPLFEKWENNFRDQWISFKIALFDLVENDQLAQGEILKADGENHDQKVFYCVLKGRMKLIVRISDKEEEYLYKVNQRFGFEQFFFEHPLTYKAQADCFTRVSKLTRSNFISCLKKFPQLYSDYMEQIQKMRYTGDRSSLNQKCWFCPQMHTPLCCTTKTRWRTSLIRKDPQTMNYVKMLFFLDKTESQSRKIYRNYIKSEKVVNKKMCEIIEIDRIQPMKSEEQKKRQVEFSDKSKFNFQ